MHVEHGVEGEPAIPETRHGTAASSWRSKFLGIERLAVPRSMIGQCLVRKAAERITASAKRRVPSSFKCHLLKNRRCERILLCVGEAGGCSKCVLEGFRAHSHSLHS